MLFISRVGVSHEFVLSDQSMSVNIKAAKEK